MAELNYKIEQISEEWKVFNNRIIRMNVEYKIRIYVPEWIYIDLLEDKLSSFDNLHHESSNTLGDGTEEHTYTIKVSTVSKCDVSKDEFSEVTGVYICETKAEIKVLEKTKKVMNSLFKVINGGNNSEKINNSISDRIDKNDWNLKRLEGIDLNDIDENEI